MHSLTKTALGPAITQLAKLKTEEGEQTKDQTEQLGGWMEHYSKLYAQDVPEHPGMEPLLHSFGVYAQLVEPTEEEPYEAISVLSSGNGLGKKTFLLNFLRKIKMFFSRGCMHCCCNAGDNVKSHTQCRTPKLLPCTNIRETRATVLVVGEYLSFLWQVRSSLGS